MPGWRSHTEIIAWQIANELKLSIYQLIRQGPVARDFEFCDQIRRSARSAPRNIAEGFGRFLPGEFVKYLRWANGELKETFDALQDGRDQGYFSDEETLRLQRLCKRGSKAATRLIAYLNTAKAAHERSPRRSNARRPDPSAP
jgi:four helix bundle protein